jgi:hypothetical protein
VLVLTLAGLGNQRGIDHGREQAAEIAKTVTALKAYLAGQGMPPGTVARRLANSPLPRVAAELTPDLWQEVTSLAHASRVPFDDVLLLVFAPDLGAYAPQDQRVEVPMGGSVVARMLPGQPKRPDPSGFGDILPPQPPTTELGQTVDLPDWARERMRVLRLGPPDAPNALVMAYPGSLGLCGANDAGLAVATNALPSAPVSAQGLGTSFIVRRLLTMTSVADAELFLTSTPAAVGRAYTIAAPDGLACFEVDSNGVARVGDAGSTGLLHTDHVLAPSAAGGASESSRARLAGLTRGTDPGILLADVLGKDVLVDGQRWSDPLHTFGAFRAIGTKLSCRFIDGASLAARRDWTRLTYS